jgi:hypothetical protein
MLLLLTVLMGLEYRVLLTLVPVLLMQWHALIVQ